MLHGYVYDKFVEDGGLFSSEEEEKSDDEEKVKGFIFFIFK